MIPVCTHKRFTTLLYGDGWCSIVSCVDAFSSIATLLAGTNTAGPPVVYVSSVLIKWP